MALHASKAMSDSQCFPWNLSVIHNVEFIITFSCLKVFVSDYSYMFVVNAVLLKVRQPNCFSPGSTSPQSKSTRTQPTWLWMPHMDTSVAYQSSYYSDCECHTWTQAKLINLAITQALNATHGHKLSLSSYYSDSEYH